MSYTKRQVVVAALEEIGIASFEYDLAPEQIDSGAKKLDRMMASWDGQGIRVGYALTGSPQDIDLDADSGIPDVANDAVILNLAISLCPGYGKTPSSDLRREARKALNVVMATSAQPIERQYSGDTPSGAGNKPTGRGDYAEFLNPPSDEILAGNDSYLEFIP